MTTYVRYCVLSNLDSLLILHSCWLLPILTHVISLQNYLVSRNWVNSRGGPVRTRKAMERKKTFTNYITLQLGTEIETIFYD